MHIHKDVGKDFMSVKTKLFSPNLSKFKHCILLQLHRMLMELMNAFSRAQLLALCGQTWWKKPGENHLPLTGDHFSAMTQI